MDLNTLLAICVGLAFAVTILPASASQKLSGSQIRKLLPGSYTLVIYGFDIGVSAAGGGALLVTFIGGELKGKWSVKGDQLCVTLTDGMQSDSGCSAVQYDGKKYYSAGGVRFYSK